MKTKRYLNPIEKRIKQYLELRQSLGFVDKSCKHTLGTFDCHLTKCYPNVKTISREMVVSFLNCTHPSKARAREHQVTDLRQFCRFMFQFDSETYIPEKGLVKPAKIQVKPHIFTEEEIVKLINQTKRLYQKHPLLPHTCETIIGLLWVTGMRIGEVVNLKIEDVDTVEGIIHVQETKFYKSRLIPISKSTTKALIKYRELRVKFGCGEIPETSFFINDRGKSCVTEATCKIIRKLIIQAGLKTVQGKIPRIYDVRHSFPTRWLMDFYKTGKDPTAYLPVLATYMGHANIASTQVYLHPSIELLNMAGEKLKSFTDSLPGEIYETSK